MSDRHSKSKPRRVLYVVSLFPCWSETFIVRELERVIASGLHVDVLSLKPAHEKLVQPDAARLLDRAIYAPRGLASAPAAMAGFFAAPGMAIQMLFTLVRRFALDPVELVKNVGVWWRSLAVIPALEKNEYDWIHAHWATYPSTAAMILGSAMDVPFSFTAHAHDIFVNDHLVASKIHKAEFAVTISEFNRRLLTEKAGAESAHKLNVVHCGIEPGQIPYTSGDRDAGSILAVGRFDPIKGFRDLIAACARLRKNGVSFSCELIGDGPLRGELEELIVRFDLGDRVHFAGIKPMDYVRERLAKASVFCLPSRPDRDGNMDGIPVALMEAMAAGAPVVSTRVSGIPELIEDGVSGFLVEPNSPKELADRIGILLGDPGRARQFAQNARDSVVKGFDINREADKLVSLIDRQLQKGNAENETAAGYR